MKGHKKEIITVAILMAAAVVIFAGILKPEATQTKKCSLIYIPKIRDNTNDFWTSVISGCKMAAEEYESDLEILAPDKEENIEEQNKLLKKAIEQKPDAILFSPSSMDSSDELLKEAKEKGIRITYIDSYTKEKLQDLTVATDNVNAGRVEYLGDDREGKLAALNNAVAAIEKNYGKGSIMKLGDSGANIDIEAIPTGSISLDVALGVGGVPRGRIIEIYGPESSGKTTVALHMIAEAQKRNGIAGFIDAEHALDPQYAKKIGVDIDNLYISQPDNGEQALEIAETMIRSGALDIVIVDSVAALVPKAEIEGDMDDQQVGLHARLMSKAMRKLTGVINRSNCAVVFINQLREKVGIMFGNPEVTTGGRALKFYSSVRMDVRRVEAIKQGGEIIGNHTKVKVVKNKVAPPFKEAEFDIMFGQGISREGDLIDLAVKVDAVQKSGAWYAYKGEKIGQGRENAKTFLREHPEIMEEVEVQVREYYNLPTDTVVESASQEEGQPKAGDNQNGQFNSITTEE